jgi:hypothetical protein
MTQAKEPFWIRKEASGLLHAVHPHASRLQRTMKLVSFDSSSTVLASNKTKQELPSRIR